MGKMDIGVTVGVGSSHSESKTTTKSQEYVGSNIDFDWVQEGVKSIVSEVESYKYGKIDEYDS